MEQALDCWRARRDEPWLVGCEPARLRAMVEAQQAALARRLPAAPVEITTENPLEFVVEFLGAISHWSPLAVFLGPASPSRVEDGAAGGTRVMIATGGTTGAPRYAVHTWITLTAAARALQTRLGGGPIHSICFLPLSHVSGLMQVVRSFATGGTLVLAEWSEIQNGRFPAVPVGAVTSVVPTQLARLLEVPGAEAWLRHFRAVFVGGAGAWPDLLERGRRARLPLSPCYGMTETAAQITTMMPDEFLSGAVGVGRALSHAKVEIVDESSGQVLPPGETGRIRIRATSLFHGYDLESIARLGDSFLTPDRGTLSADGALTVLGRSDAIINTGGEKVDPVEIEAAIRATSLVRDVAVVGLPDPEWGEVVVAVVVGSNAESDAEIAALVSARLPPPKRPKRWVHVVALPRSPAGKIDRRQLRRLAEG